MKRFFIAVAFAAMMLLAQSAKAQYQQMIPTVSVNGSAQLKVTPDEIYISIKLDESDTKGKITLDEQRRNMFAALKKAGVDAEKHIVSNSGCRAILKSKLTYFFY